jgi:hypothetical protein
MIAEFKKLNNSIQKWFRKIFNLCMLFFYKKKLEFLFLLFLLIFSLGKLLKLFSSIKNKLLKKLKKSNGKIKAKNFLFS